MTSEVQNARMAARVEPADASNCKPAALYWRQVDIEELIAEQTKEETIFFGVLSAWRFFREAEWDQTDPRW